LRIILELEHFSVSERVLLLLLILATSIIVVDQFYIIQTYPPQRGESPLRLLSYEFRYYSKLSFEINILKECLTVTVELDSLEKKVINGVEVIAFSFNQSVIGEHYLKCKLLKSFSLHDYDFIVITLYSDEPRIFHVVFVSSISVYTYGWEGWREYSSFLQAGWNKVIISLYSESRENEFFNASAIDEVWIGVDITYPNNIIGNVYFHSITLYGQLIPIIILNLSPVIKPIEIVNVYINGTLSEYISVTEPEMITLYIIYPYMPDKTYVIELILNYALKYTVVIKSPSELL
jgi:hypothetical protein